MPRPSAAEVRARVVDAAAACFRELGVAGTSVDDLVRASGIPRSTLYRHVGDRNDVLLAVIEQEVDALHAGLVERLEGSSTLADLLVDGALHAVELVRESAVLREVLANPALLADEVSAPALETLVARLEDFVSPLFDAHARAVRPGLEPRVALEHLVRTIHSLVAFDPAAGPRRRDRRHYLRQTLVPVFLTDEA